VRTAPIIELTALTKRYSFRGGLGHDVLRGVTLSIAPGEHVAILGKSGSGKSTLLNLVAALDRPTAGDVRVAATEVGLLRENALALWRARTLGVVFQFFQLLPTLTALENIMLAMEFGNCIPTVARRARANELLAQVELGGAGDRLPSMLSGGEQQRVAIARAMANDPPILVADEPTGNLDSETGAAIGRLFQRLSTNGKTLLVVTHDPSIAAAAGRIVELRDGTVVSDRHSSRSAA